MPDWYQNRESELHQNKSHYLRLFAFHFRHGALEWFTDDFEEGIFSKADQDPCGSHLKIFTSQPFNFIGPKISNFYRIVENILESRRDTFGGSFVRPVMDDNSTGCEENSWWSTLMHTSTHDIDSINSRRIWFQKRVLRWFKKVLILCKSQCISLSLAQ